MPCDTDSPERVLVAVLGQHSEVWSISWLVDVWGSSWHQDGISAFMQNGCTTEPIRPLPPGPPPEPRSFKELAAARAHHPPDHYAKGSFTYNELFEHALQRGLIKCHDSTRDLRLGVSVACGRVRELPPPEQYDNDWEMRRPDREHSVCICDATVQELEMVHEARQKFNAVSERKHARWQAKQFRNHERALKAAATRRENERKRRREEKDEARKQHPLGCFKRCQKEAHEDVTLSDAFSDSSSSDAKEAAYMSEGGTVHGADYD